MVETTVSEPYRLSLHLPIDKVLLPSLLVQLRLLLLLLLLLLAESRPNG